MADKTNVVNKPCAFIAADYVLLGRLAVYLGAPEHLVISPRRVTPLFVCSDLVTFLIQVSFVSYTWDALHECLSSYRLWAEQFRLRQMISRQTGWDQM